MKVGPIIAAIGKFNSRTSTSSGKSSRQGRATLIEHVLVHTGQHYDEAMSEQFFVDLKIPKPNIHLGVGGGSHASQTAEVLRKFEDVLFGEKPDVVIVVGDVNSTVACALATAKLPPGKGFSRPLLVHVESGLRSFDRAMPEEHNRVVTDHLADILFVTEPSGLANLKREGIPSGRVHFVGNTMIDTLLAFEETAQSSSVLDTLGLRVAGRPGAPVVPYALLTLHRPANVDDRNALARILDGLADLARRMPVIFPAHPRTAKRFEEFGLGSLLRNAGENAIPAGQVAMNTPGIWIAPPSGYLDFVCLMKNARLVVTDSGGIQEETTCLNVPCVTIRENTERPVTITAGTNVLAGVQSAGISKAIRKQLSSRPRRLSRPKKWDGKSATRIVQTLVRALRNA
jgi:UDP-N-acetylglucosamine 2-epimerase (non-hydrolysing)